MPRRVKEPAKQAAREVGESVTGHDRGIDITPEIPPEIV